MVAGIAAMALCAGSALAQPNGNGKGQGNGNGGGHGQSAAQSKGGGNGNGPKADRGNGNDNKTAQPAKGNGNGNKPAQAKYDARDLQRQPAKAHANAAKPRNNRNGNGNAKFYTDARSNGRGNGQGNGQGDTTLRDIQRATAIYAGNDRLIRERGMLNGCPPGLAKKHNDCTPPGLDRRDYRYDRAGWWGLPGLNDGRYRYYGGNLVRLSDAGSILGYYPLLGGALSVGNVWPSWYDAQPLPRYTQDYYSLGPSYRYADNVVYRTDPDTSAITSIAALLTGSDFQIGKPMPSGYDIYNVPYGYRDRYRDGPDARYRYSDGYIYEVDPTTQLIRAAIELLA